VTAGGRECVCLCVVVESVCSAGAAVIPLAGHERKACRSRERTHRRRRAVSLVHFVCVDGDESEGVEVDRILVMMMMMEMMMNDDGDDDEWS
jgi:hypothetical protein